MDRVWTPAKPPVSQAPWKPIALSISGPEGDLKNTVTVNEYSDSRTSSPAWNWDEGRTSFLLHGRTLTPYGSRIRKSGSRKHYEGTTDSKSAQLRGSDG